MRGRDLSRDRDRERERERDRDRDRDRARGARTHIHTYIQRASSSPERSTCEATNSRRAEQKRWEKRNRIDHKEKTNNHETENGSGGGSQSGCHCHHGEAVTDDDHAVIT